MKIGLLITARLKSSRLPFKLLKDLNGYSIIEHVIQRAKQVTVIDKVVVCTSTNTQDLPLVEVAQKNGIYYFLGSEEDVLYRLHSAASFYNFDGFVVITGENPLFSVDFASRVIDGLVNQKADFVTIEGLPVGCAVYGVNNKALEVICKIKSEIDTEIWGPLINRPDIFKVVKIEAGKELTIEGLRLTNDYPEDFQLMTEIFSHFPYKALPSLERVIQLLKQNPELHSINKHCVQRGLEEGVVERIDEFYTKNRDMVLNLKKEIYEK